MMARMDWRNVVTAKACSAVVLAVAVHVLVIAPAYADWFRTGASGASAGRAGNFLKKTMEDALDLADRGVTASINDDKRGLANVLNEFDNFEARAASNVFWELDVFERIGSAAKRRLKVAGEKIHSIFGGAREGAADSRAALAVDKDTRDRQWPSKPQATSENTDRNIRSAGRGGRHGFRFSADSRNRGCCARSGRNTECGDRQNRNRHHTE